MSSLRHIRKNLLEMTQEELAEKLGVSPRTYMRYEKSDLMPETARKLLDVIIEKSKKPVSRPATARGREL